MRIDGEPDVAPAVEEPLPPPALLSRHWRRWLETEHLALALTLSYVFLAAIGMLHRSLVLLKFRINLLDYAEPSDLLLAALRDPLIVLVCIAPIPLTVLYYRGAWWLQRRYANRWWTTGGARGRAFQQRWRGTLFVLTAMLWALAFSLEYANRVATGLRDGKGRRVQVELVNGVIRQPGDTVNPLLLGTTQKYVFLYDDVRQLTHVVPVDNVAQILYDRRRPTLGTAPAPAKR